MSKNISQATKLIKVSKIPTKIPTSVQGLGAIIDSKEVFDAFKELLKTQKEIEAIRAEKEVRLAEIKTKYKAYRYLFDKVFEERDKSLNKFFNVIDQGIATNNIDMILAGMQNVTSIVQASPLAQAKEMFVNTLQNGGKIEL
ncbi:hypothetical protein [Brachyspira pulli]|uniref:hypothetical protein n=1 Tax=Brachyspira pulli TaxID=310721 RepID=UPI003004AAB8